MSLIDQAYLENHVGGSETLLGYAKQVAANITNAIAAAHGAFKSAALKRGYTAASIDALTVGTAPAFWKSVLAKWALGDMTSGDGGRPQNITDGWDDAVKQLSFLATGSHAVDELTLTSTPQARIGTSTTASENAFDRYNTNGEFDRRVVKI